MKLVLGNLVKFYRRILRDHSQPVKISNIADFERTSVSYEQRVLNENWTFDNKPRDVETGNEVAPNNDFVIRYLILERRLSAYKGSDLWEYVRKFVNSRNFTSILSIGSGPCAVEMEIAQGFVRDYQWDCIDLNENLIRQATKRAQALGYNLQPIVGDINQKKFDKPYDLIVAVASLHHFVELEKLFLSVSNALKPDGEFVVYEPICKSGMFLFRRQRLLLALLFLFLPKKYRLNHQDYGAEKRCDRFYNEYDRSGWTFECIRSGDIPQLLKAGFKVKHWGRGMTFLRRVSDSVYGPNFDLRKKKDNLIVGFFCLLDRFVRFFRLVPVEGLFFIGKRK